MNDCGKNEEILIEIPSRQARRLITEYYKKYENFNGKINFKLYCKGFPDGWGFTDYYGRMDLEFIENLTVLDQTIKRSTSIEYKDLDLSKIFRPFLDDEEYELTNRWGLDIDVDAYGKEITFNGVRLYAKRKEKEKVLKK